MAKSKINTPSSKDTKGTNSTQIVQRSEIGAMLLEQFGNEYKPTEAQFDKMIALREKAMDYTHAERTKLLPKQKIEIGVFIGIIVAFIAIIWIVSVYANEFVGAAVTGALGFLSGGAGGYGIGKSKVSRSNE